MDEDGVCYEPRRREEAEGDGERREMPAPDSLIAAAQLCVPL